MSISEQWFRANMRAVSTPSGINSASLESREDCVRRDLALRLKRICENLSRVEFDALIVQMTREQLRGEGLIGRKPRPC
jgi:hypothetical protein